MCRQATRLPRSCVVSCCYHLHALETLNSGSDDVFAEETSRLQAKVHPLQVFMLVFIRLARLCRPMPISLGEAVGGGLRARGGPEAA